MKKIIAAFLFFPLMVFGEYSTEDICDAAHKLNALGLFPATAGNLSKRVDEELIAITVSGRHKGELEAQDFTLVDPEGRSLDPKLKPSAETALHLLVYRLYPNTGAVIHTHSLAGTVLSLQRNTFVTDGYEIHKVFPGVTTHESRLELPMFENTQDYDALCREIEEAFKDKPEPYGFFLRGHGLYTWGKDVKEARNRTEAYEFLFQCELRMAQGDTLRHESL